METFESVHTLDAIDHNCIGYSSTFSCRVSQTLKSISAADSYSKAGNQVKPNCWSGMLKDVLGAAAVCIYNFHHTYVWLSACLMHVSVPPCAAIPSTATLSTALTLIKRLMIVTGREQSAEWPQMKEAKMKG